MQGSDATGGYQSHYQWQISYDGILYTAAPNSNSGIDYHPYTSATQTIHFRRAWMSICDTVYSNVLTYVVHQPAHDTIRDIVCQGSSYTEYGFNITESETAVIATLQRTHTGSTIYGCDSTTTLYLTISPISRDTLYDTICYGEDYNNNGFSLTNLSTGINIETLNLSTSNGCDSILCLILNVLPAYRDTIFAEMCEGDSYDLLGFSITPEQTIGQQQIVLTQEGQTAQGCDSTFTLVMNIIDTSLRIISTQDFCENASTDLVVETTMDHYTWNNGSNEAEMHVTLPGLYTVTAMTGSCVATASIYVAICEGEVFLPNAITPNNHDGLNDYFYIPERSQNMMSDQDFEVAIFNRWCSTIYVSHDKNFKWYGDYRGTSLQNETVNYLIRYTDTMGNQKTLKGSIVVL